jgi:hypothetical protein
MRCLVETRLDADTHHRLQRMPRRHVVWTHDLHLLPDTQVPAGHQHTTDSALALHFT